MGMQRAAEIRNDLIKSKFRNVPLTMYRQRNNAVATLSLLRLLMNLVEWHSKCPTKLST